MALSVTAHILYEGKIGVIIPGCGKTVTNSGIFIPILIDQSKKTV